MAISAGSIAQTTGLSAMGKLKKTKPDQKKTLVKRSEMLMKQMGVGEVGGGDGVNLPPPLPTLPLRSVTNCNLLVISLS